MNYKISALLAKKPKYTRKKLCQMHIFDTIIGDPVFQKAYIANALVNLWDLLFIFYKIDLLLKH